MQQGTRTRPLSLVCVAAPEDAAQLDHWQRLIHPLEQAQFISVWSERQIPPGADRQQELERMVEMTDLVVLLLSADFFANPGCMALSGGVTVWRHYVIRWLLARHHTFPFRAQAFLDDATSRILLRRVGGGYSFIHRRLQDYFADAPPSQN